MRMPQRDPATWRTWLLMSDDELRPRLPPTRRRMSSLNWCTCKADRDEAMVALIHKWNSRPAVLPWTEVANAALTEFKMPPVRQARAHGMLQTAMYDAVVAAYDAQEAYAAPYRRRSTPQITPLEGSPARIARLSPRPKRRWPAPQPLCSPVCCPMPLRIASPTWPRRRP